jgi:hypothetical protein
MQDENASIPMTFKLHIRADETSESNRQHGKHSWPRQSIDAGTGKKAMGWFVNARFRILVTAGIAGMEEGDSSRPYTDYCTAQALYYYMKEKAYFRAIDEDFSVFTN